MDILRQHEIFEIEILEKMNSAKLLEPIVFGGGTMLRLCHELNRYSADPDFWFIRNTSHQKYADHMQQALEKNYDITDANIKQNTILFELRAARYPKRLKIEIRRQLKECDYQKTIAFSKFTSKQVLVNAHTLEQTMKNKIEAFLDRGEIRDCFDIEFLMRRGVSLPDISYSTGLKLRKKISKFKVIDFKVKLGSILEKDVRDYYVENGFTFLEAKLNALNPS